LVDPCRPRSLPVRIYRGFSDGLIRSIPALQDRPRRFIEAGIILESEDGREINLEFFVLELLPEVGPHSVQLPLRVMEEQAGDIDRIFGLDPTPRHIDLVEEEVPIRKF